MSPKPEKPDEKPAPTPGACVVPAQLVPHLQALLATGLYGATFQETVERCLECAIERAMARGLLPRGKG